MGIIYMIEREKDEKKSVYRKYGDPYFAIWSVVDHAWVSPDFLDDEEMEKIFLMQIGVDVVTEEEAYKQIEINNNR